MSNFYNAIYGKNNAALDIDNVQKLTRAKS